MWKEIDFNPGICESCWINHEFREPNWDDPKDMGG